MPAPRCVGAPCFGCPRSESWRRSMLSCSSRNRPVAGSWSAVEQGSAKATDIHDRPFSSNQDPSGDCQSPSAKARWLTFSGGGAILGARCAAGTSSRRRPPALQVGRVRWNLKSMGRSVHRCLPRVSARMSRRCAITVSRSSRPTVPASRPSRRTRARSTPAESSAATASAHDSPVPRKTGTGWASCTAVNSGPFACALACRVSRLTTPSTSETAAGRPPLPRQYHWNGGRPAHAAGRYVQCPLDRRGG